MRVIATLVMPLMLVASAAAQDTDAAAIPAVAASALPVTDAADIETEIDGGVASYYGHELAGNRTANGERFDPGQPTASPPTLPLGTKVPRTHPTTREPRVLRINQPLPFSARVRTDAE